MKAQIQDISFNSQYGEQYAITLEFELQRQKEKNKILEERLKNKEIFIAEMKKMQNQMEMLTEKCRQELYEERQKREVLQDVTLREYAETIAELEHKINLLELASGPERKRYANELSRSRTPPTSKSRPKKASQQMKLRQKETIKQQSMELFKNFANRFLQMYSIYNEKERDHDKDSMKKNLKAGWKWIKNVVKQWQQKGTLLKQVVSYVQECKDNEESIQPETILGLMEEEEDSSGEQQA